MTDFAALLQPDRGESAHSIHLVDKDSFEDWLKSQPAARRSLLKAMRFDGKTAGQYAILPAANGGDGEFEVSIAVADGKDLSPWCLAKLGEALPPGRYRLAAGEPGAAALGWLLGQHRFEQYRTKAKPEVGPRVLLTGEAARIDETIQLARATALVRDLVDTPAADLGPAELEQAVREQAAQWGAEVTVNSGDALEQGYPMVAAVGRAAVAARAPRMIELSWGDARNPRVAVIGKGVCFDSGGLDLKPASGMRLMKKDMGGAAHALALAGLIVGRRLPVRLHMLIPAVENAVAGSAFRPGDVLTSRAGTTVEIDNTDAEGRLILADAITRAGEEDPDLIIDFATLTGAARIALGPDLPPLFVNDDGLADVFATAAADVSDPLWRMPLWDGYDDMLKSDVADMANSADSPMAGCITAALFLRRFVQKDIRWAHIDTFAWRPTPRPGRPKGGEALGLRATFAALERLYGGDGAGR